MHPLRWFFPKCNARYHYQHNCKLNLHFFLVNRTKTSLNVAQVDYASSSIKEVVDYSDCKILKKEFLKRQRMYILNSGNCSLFLDSKQTL